MSDEVRTNVLHAEPHDVVMARKILAKSRGNTWDEVSLEYTLAEAVVRYFEANARCVVDDAMIEVCAQAYARFNMTGKSDGEGWPKYDQGEYRDASRTRCRNVARIILSALQAIGNRRAE